MYASSAIHLGRFEVPSERFGQKVDEWVPLIQFIPEPPIVVRGSMNPWDDERKRVLLKAEQDNWVKIQALQQEWPRLKAELHVLIDRYNKGIWEIDKRMEELGMKKSGMSALDMATFIVGFIPGFGTAAMVMKLATELPKLIGMLTGKTKRRMKDLKNWIRDVTAVAARMDAIGNRFVGIQTEARALIGQSEFIKSAQQAQAAVDVAATQGAYSQRKANEQTQAAQYSTLVQRTYATRGRRSSDAL